MRYKGALGIDILKSCRIVELGLRLDQKGSVAPEPRLLDQLEPTVQSFQKTVGRRTRFFSMGNMEQMEHLEYMEHYESPL